MKRPILLALILAIGWRWRARNFGSNKDTGKIISEMDLPAAQTGIPMAFELDGRSYIVVPVAQSGVPAELIALTLA